jgi:release factor glutamine methyltransferase
MHPISPASPAIEGLSLARLGPELSRTGYAEFCATFSPLAPRLECWIAHREDAPLDLRGLIDLFLLARPARWDDLPAGIRDVAEMLADAGILIAADGTVRTPGLVLLPVLGYWLFFQKPARNPKLYFGDDSAALAHRLRPQPGGTTLDLCAGPGIQSLVASGISRSVTAVEINPAAAQLAGLNAVLNCREDRITVLTGDLYEPLPPDMRFDHIVANPPLLPVPPGMRYPFVGDGGADGLAVTRRIVMGMPSRLDRDGTAQLIGTGLSDGLIPFVVDELGEWARTTGLDIWLTVAAHVPLAAGTPMFDGLVETAGGGAAREQFGSFLTERGATHLAAYFLFVRWGRGRLMVQDMSRDELSGLWFV